MKVIDLTGRRFGMLLVLHRADPPERYRNDRKYWLCRCDCGVVKAMSSTAIRKEVRVKSCGCIRVRHGLHKSKTYRIWNAMLERCRNQRHVAFKYYGGKGITVCADWKSFENFYADMGPCPEGFSIERKNSNGNYEPSNCVWLRQTEQTRNTSRTIRVHYEGRDYVLTELARKFNLHHQTLKTRLEAGIPVKQAVRLRSIREWQ